MCVQPEINIDSNGGTLSGIRRDRHIQKALNMYSGIQSGSVQFCSEETHFK